MREAVCDGRMVLLHKQKAIRQLECVLLELLFVRVRPCERKRRRVLVLRVFAVAHLEASVLLV